MRQFLLALVPKPMREAGRMLLRREPRSRAILIGTYLRRIVGLHRSDRLPSEIGPDARVLFVCHGNIFRSPMAEALFAREVMTAPGSVFRTSSGGLHTDAGMPAPAEASAAAAIWRIGLDAHRTTLVTHELLATADVVVVMDHENEADLLARFPEAGSRLVMLGAFDPLVGTEGLAIADPYGKGVEQVKACYARVARSVVGLHQALTRNAYTRVPRSAGVLRAAAQTALTSSLVRPLWRPFTQGVSTIFMLHRFSDPETGTRGHDPALLDRTLAWLRRERYHILSLSQWVEFCREGRPAPDRSVLFTVDDGYADFARIALPIFAKYECPVTQFLVTDPVDGKGWFWWDRVYFALNATAHASLRLDDGEEAWSYSWNGGLAKRHVQHDLIERLKNRHEGAKLALVDRITEALEVEVPDLPPPRYAAITWDEVRRASALGVTFGAHTVTHPQLAVGSDDESRRQVQESIARVRAETDAFVPIFCYPYGHLGSFGQRDERVVEAAGMFGALSTAPGFASWDRVAHPNDEDRFRVPRYSLPDSLEATVKLCCGLERVTTGARRV